MSSELIAIIILISAFIFLLSFIAYKRGLDHIIMMKSEAIILLMLVIALALIDGLFLYLIGELVK